jgi:hypothetical protein
MAEIKSCPCGCGSNVAPSKPDGDLALESFDCKLRIISMPVEKLIEMEECGKTKPLTDYEGD